MKLQVVGSSSKGNCYLLNEDFIFEFGVNREQILKALDFNIAKVKGGIVSHKHQDHAKSLKYFLDLGLQIAAPRETFRAINYAGENAIEVKEMQGIKISDYKIIPLRMQHDCECFGYIVIDRDGFKIGFFTDTCNINYNLPNLDCLMIECNYSSEKINSNVLNGICNKSLRDRIVKSHLSIEGAKNTILAQKKLKGIVLIHLSENNAETEDFHKIIEQISGVPTYIATKGIVISL